jgi:hypothetical protein
MFKCVRRIRENIASNFIQVYHVDGKLNLADIFTKEMKDIEVLLCIITLNFLDS